MKLGSVVITVAALLLPLGGAAAQSGPAEDVGTTGGGAVRDDATAPVSIEVSLSERRLRVMEGETEIRSYPVAVGQTEHPTPTGSFSVARLVWNPRWVPPEADWAEDLKPRAPGDPQNPMGRVKLFFQEPDYYIHGTDNEKSIGKAASHGCVRMANEDAVALARLVMEHGGEARPPSWFHRILNVVRSTREVRLSRPVPVRIVK
jgi:lipoprotein-anchoring transpeptidase ErfK/SrfK